MGSQGLTNGVGWAIVRVIVFGSNVLGVVWHVVCLGGRYSFFFFFQQISCDGSPIRRGGKVLPVFFKQ